MAGISSRGRKQGCFQPGPPAGAVSPDSAIMRQARRSSSAMVEKYTGWGSSLARRVGENEVKRIAGDPG